MALENAQFVPFLLSDLPIFSMPEIFLYKIFIQNAAFLPPFLQAGMI
jgi:hypothetical protein